MEDLSYTDIVHFDKAITCALMEKRYDDARMLKLQLAKPEYETSEALSEAVRSQLVREKQIDGEITRYKNKRPVQI